MTNARSAKSAREKAAAMQAEAARKEARRRTLFVSLAVLAAILVVAAAGIIIKIAQDDNAAASGGDQTPRNLTTNGIVVGKADAKVTIIAYEDFQCPACKSFEDANSEQLKAWIADGTAKVEYRPIAILDRFSPDEYSTRSMNAAAAVIDVAPDAFPAFHESLYAQQPAENTAGLTDAKLVELAVAAGAPEAQVRPLIEKRSFGQWTKTATDAATQDGVSGTPTVRVNGKVVDSPSPANLKAAVDAAASAG